MVEDVGQHRDKSQLDRDMLVAAVIENNPTVILLAFCFSKISRLNDILRAVGIYSVLIVQEEKTQITEGRYIILDEGQQEIAALKEDEVAGSLYFDQLKSSVQKQKHEDSRVTLRESNPPATENQLDVLQKQEDFRASLRQSIPEGSENYVDNVLEAYLKLGLDFDEPPPPYNSD